MATPLRGNAAFREALAGLAPGLDLDERTLDQLYWVLGDVIGQWLQELGRTKVSPIAKTIMSTGKSLDNISRTLKAVETGFADSDEIEVVAQLASRMALDPTIGSIERARQLLASFRDDATRLAHTCLLVAADLAGRRGKAGRPRLDWYDRFTELLLEVAHRAGVNPTLQKDRITQVRSGWLLDAALVLESFLYPGMRSGSPEACGKRLERSKASLQRSARQNRSVR